MWIRSQDKEKLVKLEKEIGIFAIDRKMIRVDDISAYADDENGRYSVGGLGTYWTKQKAMKVLDMIGEAIIYQGSDHNDFTPQDISNIKKFNHTHLSRYGRQVVFQMPQDNEVD